LRKIVRLLAIASETQAPRNHFLVMPAEHLFRGNPALRTICGQVLPDQLRVTQRFQRPRSSSPLALRRTIAPVRHPATRTRNRFLSRRRFFLFRAGQAAVSVGSEPRSGPRATRGREPSPSTECGAGDPGRQASMPPDGATRDVPPARGRPPLADAPAFPGFPRLRRSGLETLCRRIMAGIVLAERQ